MNVSERRGKVPRGEWALRINQGSFGNLARGTYYLRLHFQFNLISQKNTFHNSYHSMTLTVRHEPSDANV